MGDGKVALILDVLGLAQSAGVVAEIRDRSLLEKAPPVRQNQRLAPDACSSSKPARAAAWRFRFPWSHGSRNFPARLVEHSGALEVVRYRGQILPLIRVAKHVPAIAGRRRNDDPMQVVVYTEKGRSVGLVVGTIIDIVQETITVKRHAHGNGIFGSVVIQDRVTDLLDVPPIIRAADPSFYRKSELVSRGDGPSAFAA